MGQRIGVAKSAHLLGISRHELQRLIRSGALHSFDGELDFDELKQRYPRLRLNNSPTLERAFFIRKTAFSRRVRETVVPDTDALQTRLKKRDTELAVQRAKADHYYQVLEAITQKLDELQQSPDEKCREIGSELNLWLLYLLEEEQQ